MPNILSNVKGISDCTPDPDQTMELFEWVQVYTCFFFFFFFYFFNSLLYKTIIII